jgi:hypothetical protein
MKWVGDSNYLKLRKDKWELTCLGRPEHSQQEELISNQSVICKQMLMAMEFLAPLSWTKDLDL